MPKLTTGFLSCVHNKCLILVNLNQTVESSIRVFGCFFMRRGAERPCSAQLAIINRQLYTSGKTLVPFRLSGNVEWGVPFPEYEGLKDLTFWVWPESLWAPISFTYTYLKRQGKEADLSKWWYDEESKVYQFIGEDNIYFYSIAQTGLFTGLQVPKGEVPDMETVHLSHIIANRHLLYLDTKASSSSECKPPMADELLNYYSLYFLRNSRKYILYTSNYLYIWHTACLY